MRREGLEPPGGSSIVEAGRYGSAVRSANRGGVPEVLSSRPLFLSYDEDNRSIIHRKGIPRQVTGDLGRGWDGPLSNSSKTFLSARRRWSPAEPLCILST